jgi:parvulin-like peptidyl-prolyl isomerase
MKPVRLLLAIVLILALALAAVGCKSNKNVAARVNGEAISLDEFNSQVDQLKTQYPTMFEGAEGEGRLLDFKQRILTNLINAKLVDAAAKKEGITISDEDVSAQIKQMKANFKDQAQFDQALKTAGMTLAALEKQVYNQLLTSRLMDKLAKDAPKPTAVEVKAYYDANKAQFEQKAATRASHILFKADDKATAEKVLAEIKGGGDFAALAKQYSQDPASAANGGDLGWPTTPYVAEFQAALSKLKAGEISPLVKTTYGWHIIKATEIRKASTKSLADATAQIEQVLNSQKKADLYQKYVDDLRSKAKIEIFIPELKALITPSKETSSTK